MPHMTVATEPTTHTNEFTDTMGILYKLPVAQCLLLDMLIQRVVLPPEILVKENIAKNTKHVRVLASQLRKFLATKDIILDCRSKVGYWISPGDKKIIRSEIEHYLTR